MRAIISFLTRIPIPVPAGKEPRIEEVAALSYLFPFAALVIALPLTIIAVFLFRVNISPGIAALLTLLCLYFITGLMHLDGLADFFDGLMAGGNREQRIKAMKDEKIGIAGLFATFVILMLNFIAIKEIVAHDFCYPVFIIAELAAKLSMNTCMLVGKRFQSESDTGWGIGALFIKSCTLRGYLIALTCSLLLASIPLISRTYPLRVFSLFSLFIGVSVAIIISYIGGTKFGTVSGDVIGASNEIARTAVLLIWSSQISGLST